MDPAAFRSIGDLFYQTRVMRGREWTVRRFAAEVGVDPVMLGYVEKGARLPSERLVRRLAELRGEPPDPVLAVLYRDRMVRALTREIEQAVDARSAEGSVGFGTEVLSRALAALPDSGVWVPIKVLRGAIRDGLRAEAGVAAPARVADVVTSLEARSLVERSGQRVRKVGRHLVPTGPAERVALARELAGIFAKSLGDKLLGTGAPTYLRNEFLRLPARRVPEFHDRLRDRVRELVEEFASEEDEGPEAFVRVLIASTTSD